MPSLKTTVNQTYPAATLRVYRSLQIGQHPNQEDAKRAAQVAEDILSDPQSSHTSSETVETPAMSAASRLALVHRWIEATQGWLRLRASYTAGRPYDAVSILILAESCEWARLTDISGLPDAQQGKMHPVCLELGVGSCRAAYQHDKSSDARVYFFAAYRA
jgi:hypothetical protein